MPTNGIMISGFAFDLLLRAVDRRFDDRTNLHFEDFRIGDTEAAAAVAKHRIGFVKLFDAALLEFRRV